MLKISKQVRTVEEQKEELGAMIRAVRNPKRAERSLYCIVHSETTDGIMEIEPLAALYAEMKAKSTDVLVIGIAKGKASALELVRQIVEDMAKTGNGFDVRSVYG